MACDKNTVFAVAPELRGEDPGKIAQFISWALLRVNPSHFGNRYDLATAYLTAHLLTLSGREGQGGAITQIKEGDVSYTYELPEKADAMEATSYGSQYLALRRGAVRLPPAV